MANLRHLSRLISTRRAVVMTPSISFALEGKAMHALRSLTGAELTAANVGGTVPYSGRVHRICDFAGYLQGRKAAL